MGQRWLILNATGQSSAQVMAGTASPGGTVREARPPTPDPKARGAEQRLGAWLRDSATPLR